MKEILLTLTISICLSTGLAAQHHSHDENDDYIRSLKIAHITEKLQLTPAESEKFWPIYNEYRNKSHERRHTYHKLRESQAVSDAAANEMIDEILKLDASRTADKKIFYTKLRQVISPMKIIKLSKAEHEFKKEILNRIRQNSDKNG